ncbi:MAG: SprT family zinc-dependent metalloprotease [Smithellaceae bacterium]|nr:SprT family zinc-dependent metalloprotease [Smithellaceae bacterium]
MRLSHGVVSYGREKIEFSFCHVDRKTLEIAVHPNQTVVVKAPLGVESAEVQRRVAKRARWIIKQRNYFRQFEPRTPARCYVGGETHLYLGKRYRLKISSENQDSVKLLKGYFEIQVKGRVTSDKVKCLLDGWYAKKASSKFRESLDYCWPRFKKLSVVQPRLQIKRLKKRWGSLSGRGTLTLNTDLIRASKGCINYVITHELCHLQSKVHGPKFYKTLERIMPDWKKRKQKLELTLV